MSESKLVEPFEEDGCEPPTSLEWSVQLDRFERFALSSELLRVIANGFPVSVAQRGGKEYAMLRTAMVRRGSRSRAFWADKNRTLYAVLGRQDIVNLSKGMALLFEAQGAVFVKGEK